MVTSCWARCAILQSGSPFVSMSTVNVVCVKMQCCLNCKSLISVFAIVDAGTLFHGSSEITSKNNPLQLEMITQERLALFIAPVLGFWLLSASFSIIGRTPGGKRSLLQPGGWEDPKKETVSALFVAVLVFSQQIVQIAMNVALDVLGGTATLPIEPLPSWWYVILQFVGMMLVIDTWQYWGHRFAHTNRWLYVHVHSWHHRIHAPYAISASFNHPLEGLFLDTASGAIVSTFDEHH